VASIFVEISNLCHCGGEGTCHACRAYYELELATMPFRAARQGPLTLREPCQETA